MTKPKQRYRTSSMSQGETSSHAVVRLQNKKTLDDEVRDDFFTAWRIDKDGPVWIAQQICEEIDGFGDFDEERVCDLLEGCTPLDRLKVVELLSSRSNSSHKTYYHAMRYELRDESDDAARLAKVEDLLEKTAETRAERDAAFTHHYELYAYFAYADEALGLTHMGLAAVDSKTKRGVLVSRMGDHPDSPGLRVAVARGAISSQEHTQIKEEASKTKRGVLQILFDRLSPEQIESLHYSIKDGDPFVNVYTVQKKREVIRYQVAIPQDEAQKVYENILAVINRSAFYWSSAGVGDNQLCGDNAADAIQASECYLFQEYRDALDHDDMHRAPFFSDTMAWAASNVDIPWWVERRYAEYMAETKREGFVVGATRFKPNL